MLRHEPESGNEGTFAHKLPLLSFVIGVFMPRLGRNSRRERSRHGVASIFLTFLIRPRRFLESRRRSPFAEGLKSPALTRRIHGSDALSCSKIRPRYVSVLSGFFSEVIVFSGAEGLNG
jgi:hypothetical protein